MIELRQDVKETIALLEASDISIREACRETGANESTVRYHMKKSTKYSEIRNRFRRGLPADDYYEGAKKLFFDLETTPIEGLVWGLWNQNLQLDRILKDWRLICFSYKWAHKDTVHCESLHHYVGKEYLNGDDNPAIRMINIIVRAVEFTPVVKNIDDARVVRKAIEEEMVKSGLFEALQDSTLMGEVFFAVEGVLVRKLWDLLDEADIVIAHNAKKFDVKRSKAKFIEHGLKPPSPFKVVDTLAISKDNFGFTSQKLQYITELLKKGSKLATDFSLWMRVQMGSLEAYEYMEKYCDQDIRELESVYNELAPWDRKAPNVSLHNDEEAVQCIVCGSHNVKENVGKFSFTGLSKFKTYSCGDCGKHMRGRDNLLSKEKRKNILMNIAG